MSKTMAQLVGARGRGFESHCGQELFMFILSFFASLTARILTNANEMKCDIHLGFALFKLENSIVLFVQFNL